MTALIFDMKMIKRFVTVLFALVVVMWGALAIYSSDYYRADDEMLKKYYPDENSSYTIAISDNCAVFTTKNDSEDLLIFYPGAKVDTRAYIPLCTILADNGINCMIVGMPYKLAFLGINSADRVIKTMDDIGISTENVYIAGHSLGGSARASFVSKNSDKIEGLILLASYSTSDLSDKDIKVLSLYGTQDGVMHKNFYDKCWKNLPDNTIEIIIDGGNHANFGAYGNQDGDYSALISHEEQIEITAQAIIDFIQSDK